jgi:Family of unknown function (DUF6636)
MRVPRLHSDAVRALAVFGVVVTVLTAGAARAAGIVAFQTPSHNIGCIYLAPGQDSPKPYLRCDIGGGLHPLPPRPKNCDLDWGYGFSMAGTGRARPFCAGDTARIPKARILAYGKTWRKGPFTCVSQRTGLRCTNASRRGFFLSRGHSYTF